MTHMLDAPIWHALAGRQASMSRCHGTARRYDPAFAPFAAMAGQEAEDFADLQSLLAPGDNVALFTPTQLDFPAGLACRRRGEVDQMILRAAPGQSGPPPAGTRPLTLDDAPAVLELVAITNPGPFAARTLEMGRYVGVFRDGVLAAMAGERMQLDGFTEVSAVCTHPAHRGQGLAPGLIARLATDALDRGQTPFLHAFVENQAALAVYTRLGFIRRARLHLAVIGLAVPA